MKAYVRTMVAIEDGVHIFLIELAPWLICIIVASITFTMGSRLISSKIISIVKMIISSIVVVLVVVVLPLPGRHISRDIISFWSGVLKTQMLFMCKKYATD